MLARYVRLALRVAPIRIWAIMLAAPVLTATAAALTLLVWRGGWPADLAPEQLKYIGWTLIGNWALLATIVVALASVKLKASTPSGAGIEIGAQTAAYVESEPDVEVFNFDDPILNNLEPK